MLAPGSSSSLMPMIKASSLLPFIKTTGFIHFVNIVSNLKGIRIKAPDTNAQTLKMVKLTLKRIFEKRIFPLALTFMACLRIGLR